MIKIIYHYELEGERYKIKMIGRSREQLDQKISELIPDAIIKEVEPFE